MVFFNFHIQKKYGGKWALLNFRIAIDIFFFILFSKSAVSSSYSYNKKEEKVLIRGIFQRHNTFANLFSITVITQMISK